MAKKSVISKFFSKLPSQVSSGVQQDVKTEKTARIKTPKLKLVIFIVDWNRANVITNVCVNEKVRFHFTCVGMGTASSEILNLLGIGSGEKAVILCLEQEIGVQVLMKEVRKELKSHGPGAGIAFTVPLSAVNDPILLVFKQSILKNENLSEKNFEKNSGKGANMANKHSHDLILSIVNHGYTDELMNTARAAGARGGTVLHARGTAHEGPVKFFGISVQDEKEMILILAENDKKVPIMQAVSEKYGLNTAAHGLVFSLPVDNVIGLSAE
jgi:nitrogen regulatory protein PII